MPELVEVLEKINYTLNLIFFVLICIGWKLIFMSFKPKIISDLKWDKFMGYMRDLAKNSAFFEPPKRSK